MAFGILGATLGFSLGGASGFYLVSAAQVSAYVVRVVFSDAPLATDPTAADDALNPANYTLTGPILNAAASVAVVDALTVDLTLLYPLAVGYWTVDVQNVSTGSEVIDIPTEWTFQVTSQFTAESATMGAENEEAENILRKFLNPALEGVNWDHLLDALALGEQWNYDNAASAFDQMFVPTASERYLIQRASDRGIDYPDQVGMSDELFRKYTISLDNRKLTEESFLEILEVFYGTDAVRGFVESASYEPYDISAGDKLSILVDELTIVEVEFASTDFAIPRQARAMEVAASITRYFRINGVAGWATPYTDLTTGTTKVKIYSGGYGLGSSIRVTLGLAQNALKFPSWLDIYTADPLPEWTTTLDLATNQLRWKITSADLNPNLQDLKIGSYVNITGGEFATDNLGSFEITDLSISYDFTDPPTLNAWFEVYNPDGFDQTVTQLDEASITFFNATKGDQYSTDTRSVVVADLGPYVDIKLPATSAAVSRAKYSAAYLQDPTVYTATALTGKSGVATITSAGHTLRVDDWVIIDGFRADLTVPPTTAGSTSILDSSQVSIWSGTTGIPADMGQSWGGVATTMVNDKIFAALGADVSAGVYTFLVDGMETSVTPVDTNGEIVVTYDNNLIATGIDRLFSSITPFDETLSYSPQGEPGCFITGGFDGVTVYDDVYFYLSDSQSFSVLSDLMIDPRCRHTSTTFPDVGGEQALVVFGGTGPELNRALDTVELYAPISATPWAAVSPMSAPRADHAMVKLSDTEVLVSGGRPMALGPFVDSATTALWRLDDSITVPADESSNNIDFAAVNVTFAASPNSYRALTFNGTTAVATVAQPTCQPVIDLLATKTFTVEVWAHVTANLTNGPFISLGGAARVGFSFGPNSSNLIGVFYDDVGTVRRSAASTTDYTVLQATGNVWNHFAVTCEAGSVGSAVKFKFYTNGRLVTTSAEVNTPFGEATMHLDLGHLNDVPGAVNRFFDGSLSQVKVSSYTMDALSIWNSYLSGTGLTLWEDDLIAQPKERAGLAYNSCEIYAADTDTWTPTGSMTWARINHKLIALPTGEVMAIGGWGYNPSQPSQYYSIDAIYATEIWDPTSGRWSPAGNLQYNTGNLVAEYMPDENGIVVTNGGTNRVEFFDLATRKWRTIGSRTSGGTTQMGSFSAVSQNVLMVYGGRTYSAGQFGDTTPDQQQFYTPNSPYFYSGGLEGMFPVTSVDGDDFTVAVPGLEYLVGTTDFEVTAFRAEPATDIPGPFILDPMAGYAIIGTAQYEDTDVLSPTYGELINPEVTVGYAKGHRYNTVTIDEGTNFPEAGGYILFGFGTDHEVGPVQYFSKTSDDILNIDHRFTFTKDVPVGTSVTVLSQKEPYNPSNSADLGVFWLTDSPSGRAAAQKALNIAKSATSDVNIDIVYPSDRGLGAEGYPTSGPTGTKLSDIVDVYAASDDDTAGQD